MTDRAIERLYEDLQNAKESARSWKFCATFYWLMTLAFMIACTYLIWRYVP